MGDEWHEEWDKQTWRVIGWPCAWGSMHIKEIIKMRMVGLMGGESEWHRRIWAWGGRMVGMMI